MQRSKINLARLLNIESFAPVIELNIYKKLRLKGNEVKFFSKTERISIKLISEINKKVPIIDGRL